MASSIVLPASETQTNFFKRAAQLLSGLRLFLVVGVGDIAIAALTLGLVLSANPLIHQQPL